MSVFLLNNAQLERSNALKALHETYDIQIVMPDNLALLKTSGALIVSGHESFETAKEIKKANGNLTLVGIRQYPEGQDFLEGIERSYADLLENRFALSAGIVGNKGFILTGERGIALAANPEDMSRKLLALFQSRFPQNHNKTVLQKIDTFPGSITDDCSDIFHWMQEWEKLSLFPSYQRSETDALYPGAEFGFVAKRTELGTLITARASNKTKPSSKDICLITDVQADGTIQVQSTGRKASLNGPLAHLVFQNRPEIQYIVHSHVFLPEGVSAKEPSAPGTQADWRAIEEAVKSGAHIINQPYHGTIILLEKPEDLFPLLKRQSLYYAQSEYYDLAYARFQSSKSRQTSLERFIGELDLPKDTRSLDLCCGTGASTLALQELGFTNIDIADGSSGMLSVAEKRLGKTGHVVQLENLDVLAGENYGLVTIRQAFNYVSGVDLKSVFQKAHQILAPGGHFVFNSFKPLPEGVDRRQNVANNEGVIVITSEVNVSSGDLLRHAQRTEIIDANHSQWLPILDINDFYQHNSDHVVALLRESGFEAEARISGNSVCYHAVKPLAPEAG